MILNKKLILVLALTMLSLVASSPETPRRLRKRNAVFPIDSLDNSKAEDSSGMMNFAEDELFWRNLFVSMSMDACECSDDCLPSDASPFDTEASVDIGSTGTQGETTRCGPNCYILKGSGLDMCASDDVGSDALHFAYTKVAGPFVLVSKVCGGPSGDAFEEIGPRTGLMVRGSLDPLAQNFFLSHSPEAEANWSARHSTDGTTSCDFDGSPDVPCIYLIIERFAVGDGGFEFIGYYSYEVGFLQGVDTCSKRKSVFEVAFNGFSFPDEVYVGMAVLYGRDNELYESQFNEIHFADDNMFRDTPFTSRYTI